MTEFPEFADLERRGWSDDSIADSYVGLFSSASDAIIPTLIAEARPGDKVLDLCCGHGNVTERLAAAGAAPVGLDFSAAMLAHARRRVPGGEFIEGDAQNLPFDDGAFDLVVSNLGVVHVPDQPRALAEIRRVLKPGGRFAMSSWAPPDQSPALGIVFSCVRDHGDPAINLPDAPDFHQFAAETRARAGGATALATIRSSAAVASSAAPAKLPEISTGPSSAVLYPTRLPSFAPRTEETIRERSVPTAGQIRRRSRDRRLR